MLRTLFLLTCLAVVGIGCDLDDDLTASSPPPDHPAHPPQGTIEREKPPSPTKPANAPPSGEATGTASEKAPQETAGTASLKVMAWNIEWFHDAERAPQDDAAQYAAVKAILEASEADVIALAEVSDPASFARLMRELPHYEGVIADYAWTQKLALVYRDAVFDVVDTRRVGGFPNAGRPPLHVALRRKQDGFDLHVLVVHAKAGSDEHDWGKRRGLARGLEAYLDEELSDVPVIIAGDLNDRLAGSTVPRRPSPYRAFVHAPEMATPTRALHERDEASHLSGETLDHILVSDELAPFVEADSVDVLRDELSARHPSFGQTVSDHFPVVLRLRR